MAKADLSQFAFVLMDGPSGRLQAQGDRSIIRSHCMRGKNKREDSRRSIRQARRQVRQMQPSLSTRTSTPRAHAKKRLANSRSVSTVASPSPCACPSDLALVVLAADVDDRSQQLLFKFFTYDTMQYTFPVFTCVDFHLLELEYFRLLFDDEVYVHCTLLAAAAIDDFVHLRPPSPLTYFHLWRTHTLLNARLSDPKAYQLDPIIYVVMTLAIITEVLGDRAASHAHLVGLARILQMRGGTAALSHKSKLLFKIGRLDLDWALSTGQKSQLITGPETWESLYRVQSKALTHKQLDDDSSGLEEVHYQLFGPHFQDTKLDNVFHDLKQLTHIINHHTQKNTRIEGQEFQVAINSIQSRLLHLQGDEEVCSDNRDGAAAEALRLGMLAFLSTTFRVPGKKAESLYLTEHLRSACQDLEASTPELRDILFWLLMVGVISVLDVDEPWLRARWDVVAKLDMTWEAAQRRLRSIMWITSIHDDPGRKAYNILATR
ncbi:hypothetical protein BX600DRAFT_552055 [Xylariales sp. PMI_506]|nr:hypothetical protein BX600DRAFT_552055 [Xylariales sp. PMI_506]